VNLIKTKNLGTVESPIVLIFHFCYGGLIHLFLFSVFITNKMEILNFFW